jgi:hypothetical protein
MFFEQLGYFLGKHLRNVKLDIKLWCLSERHPKCQQVEINIFHSLCRFEYFIKCANSLAGKRGGDVTCKKRDEVYWKNPRNRIFFLQSFQQWQQHSADRPDFNVFRGFFRDSFDINLMLWTLQERWRCPWKDWLLSSWRRTKQTGVGRRRDWSARRRVRDFWGTRLWRGQRFERYDREFVFCINFEIRMKNGPCAVWWF